LTSDLMQPSNPTHSPFAESAIPPLQPTHQGAVNEMLNNKPSTEPLAQSCMLLTPEALPSAAVCSTNEDRDSFQAIEPSGLQNSEPAGSHDFASQANEVTDIYIYIIFILYILFLIYIYIFCSYIYMVVMGCLTFPHLNGIIVVQRHKNLA